MVNRPIPHASVHEVFRAINELLYRLDEHGDRSGPEILIVCECSDRQCMERMVLAGARYEELHGDGGTVILRPDHPAEGERGLGRDGFDLVRLTKEPSR